MEVDSAVAADTVTDIKMASPEKTEDTTAMEVKSPVKVCV